MIELASPDKCTGCMACMQACPRRCIGITQDRQGNWLPEIDPEHCISCHKCQKSCPELNPVPLRMPKKAYAAWSLDNEDRRSSASGGAASVFYQTALDLDTWICGVEYSETFHVLHTVSKSAECISQYKQSKYLFSETNGAYKTIQDLLRTGEKVVMISLPCKIAGLYQFLGKEFNNLLTVDIVCHGTPSYEILSQHIRKVLKKDQTATQLRFRHDNEFCFELSHNNQEVYRKIGRQDHYLAAFLEGLDYRDSCYQCSYAKQERVGDITICDFWGLGAEVPFDHPYTGSVSAILINTEKGQAFFEKSKERFFWEERPVWEALKGNAQFNHPTPVHPKRAEYLKKYEEVGFEKAVEFCLNDIIRADKKELQRRNIRQFLRKTAGLVIPRYRG